MLYPELMICTILCLLYHFTPIASIETGKLSVDHIIKEIEISTRGSYRDYSREEHLESPSSKVISYDSISNELQLVRNENIKIQLLSTNDTYEITNVEPTWISNNDVVKVYYKSSNPDSGDWIGAYSPIVDPTELPTTVPVKFGYCDKAKTYLDPSSPQYGEGVLYFNFTNLRESISFYYFTGKIHHPNLVNTTLNTYNVSFINKNQPLRPRVTPTGNVDIFKLSWSSYNSTTPTLKWGTISGSYTNIVIANTTTIDKSSLCGWPANDHGWRDMGLIHSAYLEGMKNLANEKLYYIFGDEITNDYSEEFTFFPPQLPGEQPPNRPTKLILYDDLGRGSTDDTYTWNYYGR